MLSVTKRLQMKAKDGGLKISNNRIVKLEDGRVTFKYKDSATDQLEFATVCGEEFISTRISLRNSLAALRCTRCWVSWGLQIIVFDA
jgi:hypothetical protein